MIQPLRASPRHAVAALKKSLLHVPLPPIHSGSNPIRVKYDGARKGYDVAATAAGANTCETTQLILETLPVTVDIGNIGGVVIEKLGVPIIVIENTQKIQNDVALINLTSFRINATHVLIEMEREKAITVQYSSNRIFNVGVVIASVTMIAFAMNGRRL